jgi:hypothetical protein
VRARGLLGRTPLLAATLLLLTTVGCAQPVAPRDPPPRRSSANDLWSYGAYLLVRDEPQIAVGFLEDAARSDLNQLNNPALLLRDLAEARLAAGDAAGAAQAAQAARTRLDQVPRTAQFQADDRDLFERVLEALDRAGQQDLDGLARLAADEGAFPSADPWFLLAQGRERRGNDAGAREAYRAYLDRAPAWSFLRRTSAMQQYARVAVDR